VTTTVQKVVAAPSSPIVVVVVSTGNVPRILHATGANGVRAMEMGLETIVAVTPMIAMDLARKDCAHQRTLATARWIKAMVSLEIVAKRATIARLLAILLLVNAATPMLDAHLVPRPAKMEDAARTTRIANRVSARLVDVLVMDRPPLVHFQLVVAIALLVGVVKGLVKDQLVLVVPSKEIAMILAMEMVDVVKIKERGEVHWHARTQPRRQLPRRQLQWPRLLLVVKLAREGIMVKVSRTDPIPTVVQMPRIALVHAHLFQVIRTCVPVVA
jgi:hypothetical protein